MVLLPIRVKVMYATRELVPFTQSFIYSYHCLLKIIKIILFFHLELFLFGKFLDRIEEHVDKLTNREGNHDIQGDEPKPIIYNFDISIH
jgi:hypothetical protein